jgi:hypothetical protein
MMTRVLAILIIVLFLTGNLLAQDKSVKPDSLKVDKTVKKLVNPQKGVNKSINKPLQGKNKVVISPAKFAKAKIVILPKLRDGRKVVLMPTPNSAKPLSTKIDKNKIDKKKLLTKAVSLIIHGPKDGSKVSPYKKVNPPVGSIPKKYVIMPNLKNPKIEKKLNNHTEYKID